MSDIWKAPLMHHLDRRAETLAAYGAAAGSLDDLLTTDQLGKWLAVSHQWLEIGRSRGYGPPFVKMGPRNARVRYRRSAVVAWLEARSVDPVNRPARPAPKEAKPLTSGRFTRLAPVPA